MVQQTQLKREDVIGILGEADDAVVMEIIRTEATPEELAAAQAWVANDEPLINLGKHLAKDRVAKLVEILSRQEEIRPGPRGLLPGGEQVVPGLVFARLSALSQLLGVVRMQ